MRVLIIVGTRPNFIKVTQFWEKSSTSHLINFKLLHAGQHYDKSMSGVFMEQFNLTPDVWLDVGKGSVCQQTAQIIAKLESAFKQLSPDLVMVVGDVNSTLAAVIAAKKMDIKVAHLESGLRSFDRSMPEEVNRVATDHLSDILFVTEASGLQNLENEGVDSERVFFVGNTMIDTLVAFEDEIEESQIRHTLKLSESEDYALVTFHRPSNVYNKHGLDHLVQLLLTIAQKRKVVFPVHPRTIAQIKKENLFDDLTNNSNIVLCGALSYFDFQHLLSHCKFVLTDSGGIQEETTFRGKPCLTVRPNTERPSTIEQGTNVLCEFTIEEVLGHIADIDAGRYKKGCVPELWDGQTTQRIIKILSEI